MAVLSARRVLPADRNDKQEQVIEKMLALVRDLQIAAMTELDQYHPILSDASDLITALCDTQRELLLERRDAYQSSGVGSAPYREAAIPRLERVIRKMKHWSGTTIAV